jgi:hypothetical protein
MTIDHPELPSSVARYLAAAVADRAAIVGSVFAADATVHDEGHNHVGIDAVREWISGVTSQFSFTSTVDEVVLDGNHITALITYRGDFPGSPVQLHNHFTVGNGLITDLDIRP